MVPVWSPVYANQNGNELREARESSAVADLYSVNECLWYIQVLFTQERITAVAGHHLGGSTKHVCAEQLREDFRLNMPNSARMECEVDTRLIVLLQRKLRTRW